MYKCYLMPNTFYVMVYAVLDIPHYWSNLAVMFVLLRGLCYSFFYSSLFASGSRVKV